MYIIFHYCIVFHDNIFLYIYLHIHTYVHTLPQIYIFICICLCLETCMHDHIPHIIYIIYMHMSISIYYIYEFERSTGKYRLIIGVFISSNTK